MAGTKEVSGVDKVFRNASTGNETGLVGMDKERDEGFNPV